MAAKTELGYVYGLRLTADRTAFYSAAAIWAVTALGAATLLRIPPVDAIAGGLVCATGHYLLELLHHLGHAYAARRTGYPMRGVHFWMLLAWSVYPRDEGDLPGRIHIRRALGGPIASGLFCFVLAAMALVARPFDASPGWVAALLFLDNLFVFTLGALLPLGFTDGSTLLRWWGK